MTREERLQFCNLCKNRKMSFQQGLLCKLTDKQADFEGSCPSFYPDNENTISSPNNNPQQFNKTTSNDEVPTWRILISVIIFIIAIVRLIAAFNR